MRILGIETSCDETSVAILETNGRRFVLETHVTASQIQDHLPYGGVVPELAARRHVDMIFPLLVSACVPFDGSGLDVIAVTAGPGLVPSLRIGVETAKILSTVWKKQLVAVNHLEGHIYSAFLPDLTVGDKVVIQDEKKELFPILCLLVSGGHTELIIMKNHGIYERLGMTRDDAVGEAFDKVAQMLGLSYPGGPAIAARAIHGRRDAMVFPRPMKDSHNFDLSFAGLKTAVFVHLKAHPIQNEQELNDDCASFQEAAVDVLVEKTVRAALQIRPQGVLLAGGVSANHRLRDVLEERILRACPGTTLLFSPLAYSGDNAAMIAAAGYIRACRNEFVNPLELAADPHLSLV